MLFMLFMIFGIAAWFLYDGYILWPGEAQRHAEYLEIKDMLIDAGDAVDGESTSVRLAWERHAREMDIGETFLKSAQTAISKSSA